MSNFASTVKYSVALSAVALGFVVPAVSHANTAVTNLNKLLSNTKSMTANFEQTTKANGRSKVYRGNMAVQRGNQFRWNITSPAKQLIVVNGSTMWTHDPDLNQATKQSVTSQVGDTPAVLLSGDPAQIAKSFNISQPNPAKNYYLLTPKSGSSEFRDLSISFNGGRPVMMVLNDNLGQTTSIKFSNISMNKKINVSQFNFTPPAGTDVINQ